MPYPLLSVQFGLYPDDGHESINKPLPNHCTESFLWKRHWKDIWCTADQYNWLTRIMVRHFDESLELNLRIWNGAKLNPPWFLMCSPLNRTLRSNWTQASEGRDHGPFPPTDEEEMRRGFWAPALSLQLVITILPYSLQYFKLSLALSHTLTHTQTNVHECMH